MRPAVYWRFCRLAEFFTCRGCNLAWPGAGKDAILSGNFVATFLPLLVVALISISKLERKTDCQKTLVRQSGCCGS